VTKFKNRPLLKSNWAIEGQGEYPVAQELTLCLLRNCWGTKPNRDMSALGLSRQFDDVRVASAFPPTVDMPLG
jgi:hypothetical protein